MFMSFCFFPLVHVTQFYQLLKCKSFNSICNVSLDLCYNKGNIKSQVKVPLSLARSAPISEITFQDKKTLCVCRRF